MDKRSEPHHYHSKPVVSEYLLEVNSIEHSI